MSADPVVPFLKWAGGKRWFVSRYKDHFPEKFNTYYEPFLGGGAAFFTIQPSKSVLADLNQELVSTYAAIREDWKSVVDLLRQHQAKHCKRYYYKIRSEVYDDKFRRAAQFLYLNRTCWNGLYRVNLKGQFNVPIGTKSTVMMDSDDFENIAKLLRNAELVAEDFETIIDRAGKDDFVFADPPYTVKHNMNGFVKYNEKLFTWDDQKRLKRALSRAADRGAKILLTNANHQSIRGLYRKDFFLTKVQRSSVLSADPAFRTQVGELVVTSYDDK